jgi:hypothetical protein
MLLPLSDSVWAMFFRGMVFGFLGGLVLILVFFWSSGKYGALAAGKPIVFVYFLVGVEVGIAVIGMVVFAGLQAMRIHSQHTMDRMKNGGAS